MSHFPTIVKGRQKIRSGPRLKNCIPSLSLFIVNSRIWDVYGALQFKHCHGRAGFETTGSTGTTSNGQRPDLNV